MGKRKQPLPGFPVDVAFSTTTEAEAYRQASPLVCLRCGHPFRVLGKHLNYVHDMTSREYCDLYNIRFGSGLADDRWHVNQSTVMKMLRATDNLIARMCAQSTIAPRRSRDSTFAQQRRREAMQNALRTCKHCSGKFANRDVRTKYCSLACRIAANPLRGVERTPTLPCTACGKPAKPRYHDMCLPCWKREDRRRRKQSQ